LKPLFMVAFYIHHKLLKHMQEPIFTLEWINKFFHIFLAFNMCIWIEPFTFNMLKLLLTSCIWHVWKYIETHAIQCFLIIFNWFVKFCHIFWTINICTWVESFIFVCVKSIIQELHFAFITNFWYGYIKTWQSHMYIWID
jgi:hypothetical protein